MQSTLRSPEKFREALKARGLSTRALAHLVSEQGHALSHGRVGHLRLGQYPNVGRDLARRIERALGVPDGELFSDEPSTGRARCPYCGQRKRTA